jgi:Ku protein
MYAPEWNGRALTPRGDLDGKVTWVRSIWKGAVSFGLVSIPVKLYSATEEKDISFHQVRRSDGSRIRYKRVAEADGEEVSYGDIAKGYQLDSGEVVVLTDEDFADLPLPSKQTDEVLQRRPARAGRPDLLARSYYLEPRSRDQAVLLRPGDGTQRPRGGAKVAIGSVNSWPRYASGTASS